MKPGHSPGFAVLIYRPELPTFRSIARALLFSRTSPGVSPPAGALKKVQLLCLVAVEYVRTRHSMMKLSATLAAGLWLTVVTASAQSDFGITLSGFVKTDLMYDTRQTVNLREGHFLLYPAPVTNDTAGKDINANPAFNILSIQSRLTGKLTAPDALGAKISGLLEGEFFGTSDGDANGFRLRHAFVTMDWGGTSVLIGQFWHPMFVAEMFPGVVSFNTGVPFQPFSRNPQVRFTYTVQGVKLIVAAMTQRDFQSNGPAGCSSSYLRNAAIPNLHAQVQYAEGGHLIGAGVDYKKLKPRLVTSKNITADATIESMAGIGFLKVDLDPVTLKAEGTYGENLADLLMLGGYAVTSVDPVTGAEDYTSGTSCAFWGEVSTGRDVEVAVFAGYAKNLGTRDDFRGPVYGRGMDIERVFRISPRLQWNSGKLRFSGEVEHTSARYGIPNGLNNGKVEHAVTVSNTRALLAAWLFF
jgi:hypothetical protein